MILESLNCSNKKQNPKTKQKKNKSKCNACGQKKVRQNQTKLKKKD